MDPVVKRARQCGTGTCGSTAGRTYPQDGRTRGAIAWLVAGPSQREMGTGYE